MSHARLHLSRRRPRARDAMTKLYVRETAQTRTHTHVLAIVCLVRQTSAASEDDAVGRDRAGCEIPILVGVEWRAARRGVATSALSRLRVQASVRETESERAHTRARALQANRYCELYIVMRVRVWRVRLGAARAPRSRDGIDGRLQCVCVCDTQRRRH